MIRREYIRLTVSNIIFHLEKRDYETLSSYLKNGQQHYHSLPNGQKLFQDFEFSVSEFLLDKLKDGDPYVTAEHISEARAFHGSFSKNRQLQNVNKAGEPVRKVEESQPFRESISSHENVQKVVIAVLSILGLSF